MVCPHPGVQTLRRGSRHQMAAQAMSAPEGDCDVCAGRAEANMRVILVDDNVLFLETLATELARNPAIQVVARATSGVEGLALAGALQPDVVITDLAMPCMNGLDLTHNLKQLPSPPRVVMLSMYDEPEYCEGAMLVGADAYIAKHNAYPELLPLLRRLNDETELRNTSVTGMQTAHTPV